MYQSTQKQADSSTASFAGAPKRLFGFNPADIIGRPVASVVDVFGLWRNQFGEDSSLLTLLFFDALKSGRDAVAADKRHVAGSSWRVGVHLPVKSDDEIASHAAQLAAQAERKKVSGVASAVKAVTMAVLHLMQSMVQHVHRERLKIVPTY